MSAVSERLQCERFQLPNTWRQQTKLVAIWPMQLGSHYVQRGQREPSRRLPKQYQSPVLLKDRWAWVETRSGRFSLPKENANRIHLPAPVHYMHRCGEKAWEMVGISSCVLIGEYLWKRPERLRSISRAVIAFCFPSLLNDHVRRRPIKVNKLIKPG